MADLEIQRITHGQPPEPVYKKRNREQTFKEVNRMCKKPFPALVLVIALLIVTTSVMAINFGERDNWDHPYVGLMIFSDDLSTFYACSGSLIASNVFLTTGHCAANATYAWVTFEEVPAFPLGGPTWITGTAYAHPDFNYDDFAPPDTYDIGVVVLHEDVTDITPATIAPLGYLKAYEKAVGLQDALFDCVGYGLQSRKPRFEWDLARYKGVQRITNLVSYFNNGHNVQFTNNPGLGNGSGGTCSGDSGGPILKGDMIVAVNSFGIAPHCKGNDFAYRVDIQSSYDFLEGYVVDLDY